MAPDLLRAAGEALFGREWQTPLATALDVQPRRVREWVAGDRSIPPGVRAEIVHMLREAPRRLIEEAEERAAACEALATSVEVSHGRDRRPLTHPPTSTRYGSASRSQSGRRGRAS